MQDSEPLSSLTSFIGFLLSIVGLVMLIIFAALYGRTRIVVGFSIFGSGLILLYLVSAVYHLISKTHWAKEMFRSIDHSAIYFFIASTYTPLTLALPQRGWGWSLFGIIWGLACVGIVLEMVIKDKKRWLTPVLSIAMGWMIFIAFPVLLKTLPLGGIVWLLVGGCLYMVGVIFFALEHVLPRRGWFGMHEVWHLFVMAGSFSHFWLMFKYVLYM